jgi:hypothetical protein
MVGGFGGRGFLAALILPSGVDDGVMLAVAPLVDIERIVGRFGSSKPVGEGEGRGSEGVGEEGAGDEGEGEAKGLSESKSSPGVETVDAMTDRKYVIEIGRLVGRRKTCLDEHASEDNGRKL